MVKARLYLVNTVAYGPRPCPWFAWGCQSFVMVRCATKTPLFGHGGIDNEYLTHHQAVTSCPRVETGRPRQSFRRQRSSDSPTRIGKVSAQSLYSCKTGERIQYRS